MLKAYGNIFSDSKEKLQEITAPLVAAGFEIAYQSEIGGIIVKEVSDEPETSES